MSNSLLVVLGAVSACLGVLSGIARERLRRPKPARPVKPVCGCNHALAMHDMETNRCHEVVDWRVLTNGRRLEDKCPCRQYTGPRPIDQVFLP